MTVAPRASSRTSGRSAARSRVRSIRVKVGDTIRVHLKNPATNQLPHSIDFHASQVAWNDEMTSINPGEEKLYEWTADYAGVWMYHCGTSPALHHIANGMYGMVIVEPKDGLPPVDKEFALVQSEWYLGPQGEHHQPRRRRRPARRPPTSWSSTASRTSTRTRRSRSGPARRVRIFVLDAGPNIDSSFHIVGTIFDTVDQGGHPRSCKGNAGIVGLAGRRPVAGPGRHRRVHDRRGRPLPDRHPRVQLRRSRRPRPGPGRRRRPAELTRDAATAHGGPPAEDGACCEPARRSRPDRPSPRRPPVAPRGVRSPRTTTGGSPSAVCSSRRPASRPRWPSPRPRRGGRIDPVAADPPRPGRARPRRAIAAVAPVLHRGPRRVAPAAVGRSRIARDRARRRSVPSSVSGRRDGRRARGWPRSAVAPTSLGLGADGRGRLRPAPPRDRAPAPTGADSAYAAALADVAVGVAIATADGRRLGAASIGAWAALKPAHAWLNVFGFLSIVVAATLVHLAPTVVGARIQPRRSATIALVGLAWRAPRWSPSGSPVAGMPSCASGPSSNSSGRTALAVHADRRAASAGRVDRRPRLASVHGLEPRRRPALVPGRDRRSPPRGSSGSARRRLAWDVGAIAVPLVVGLDRPGPDRFLDPPDPGDRPGRPARARRLAPPSLGRMATAAASWPGTPGSPRCDASALPAGTAVIVGVGTEPRRREPPDRPGAARRGPAASRGRAPSVVATRA